MNKIKREITHRSRISIFLAFLTLFALTIHLNAAQLKVPEQFATIQAAINIAASGDEIIVLPGTYHENINFLGKNLILRSNFPADQTPSKAYISATIINGNNNGSVVTFSGTENASCQLKGFTITKGLASYGGGINGNGTLATISYNNISSNTATIYGGGLYDCDGDITNNDILANGYNSYADDYTYRGGGFYGCDGLLYYNKIFSNAAYYGAGLYGCSGLIRNNSIFQNTARINGGAIDSCDGTISASGIKGIINNTIYKNYALRNGGGIYFSKGTIMNNIIYGNLAPLNPQILLCDTCSMPSYCLIENWASGGTGNINGEPKFIDPAKHDFHLQDGSPCIDKGSPDSRFNDECMPPGKGTKINDIGSYGWSSCGWSESLFPEYYEDYNSKGQWQLWNGSFSKRWEPDYGEISNGRMSTKYYKQADAKDGGDWHQWSKITNITQGLDLIVGYEPNSLYILRVKMSADRDTKLPGSLMVRIGSKNSEYTIRGVFDQDPYASQAIGGHPTTKSANFFLIWQPTFAMDAFLNFDILNSIGDINDTYEGEIYIEEFAVYRTTIPPADSTEYSATTFPTSLWATTGTDSGKVKIETNKITIDPTSSWCAAGAYITLKNPIKPGNFYRLKYTLNKTNTKLTDQVRLRVGDAANGAYNSYYILGLGRDLSTTPQEFTHYHESLNERSDLGDFAVFFDSQLNESVPIAERDYASMVMTKLVIEKVSLPDLYIP